MNLQIDHLFLENCLVYFVFLNIIRAELRENIYTYIFALENHGGKAHLGLVCLCTMWTYLLKSWVMFVSQLTQARSVNRIRVNLKLPQYSHPGSLSICVLFTESPCTRSRQVGCVFGLTHQWDFSIPTLVFYDLVCFHGL